jgi:arsenite methyltransferase
VVISNGVVNLCADKRAVFADIANGRPVPEAALRDIDLWTG